MLTPLEKLKLDMYRKRFGDFSSAEEVLTLALEMEGVKRSLDPFDTLTLRHFAEEQAALENLMVLLEKEQAALQPKENTQC